MKNQALLIVTLAASAAFYIRADVLELKNGQILNGKYVGGTAGTIRFETGGGTQVIETAQATALTFTGGGAAAATPAVTPAPASAPAAAAPATVTIPAGTTLLVRMVDGASSRDTKGKRFTTTLETDLAVGGVTVARAGTKVYGRVEGAQEAGRYAGKSSLDLRLSEIVLGPNLVPIMTSGYSDAGARSGGKTVKGAAVGAGIGAIAGGGEGAAKGAAIGAVASGLKKGEAVSVSPGTLLEFQLQQPVSVSVAP
jgi:hypothetical protein